jgi:hypothetical protein
MWGREQGITTVRVGATIKALLRWRLLRGMGHDRGTSVQSAIADAIFQITGKRYREPPFGKHDLTWG